MGAPRKTPNFYLVVILVSVALVAALSIALSSKPAAKLAEGSPAATVQMYLDNINHGQFEEAAALFSENSSCSADDIDSAYLWRSARVVLLGSTINGTNATVKVQTELSNDAPIATSSVETHTFRLTQIQGQWYISGIPWPLYSCGVPTK